MKNFGIWTACLLASAALWLAVLRFCFQPHIDRYWQSQSVPQVARELARWQTTLWSQEAARGNEAARMRKTNPEWDFMARTYFVLSLANLALREPEKKSEYLHLIDRIVGDTVAREKENGIYFFLMEYAKQGQFLSKTKRSVFQDGEIALMMAARLALEPNRDLEMQFRERVVLLKSTMADSPVLSGESYPNEGWMFCNAVAVAAMKASDVLLKTDHSDFIAKWLAMVRAKLVEPKTGLVVSSFEFDGTWLDGPEGSTVWMVAHVLQIVDPVFAREQYENGKRHLARSFFGFGYAQEWPDSYPGPQDVDSGMIVPFFKLSPGSTGLALLGATTFSDTEYLKELLTSLEFGGFAKQDEKGLRYLASNQVGDAVLLYALVQGPLWQRFSGELR